MQNTTKSKTKFNITSSWGCIMITCPTPHEKCLLYRYIITNPGNAKFIRTPDLNVVTLHTIGTATEIAIKTPALYIRTKKICETCLSNKSRLPKQLER